MHYTPLRVKGRSLLSDAWDRCRGSGRGNRQPYVDMREQFRCGVLVGCNCSHVSTCSSMAAVWVLAIIVRHCFRHRPGNTVKFVKSAQNKSGEHSSASRHIHLQATYVRHGLPESMPELTFRRRIVRRGLHGALVVLPREQTWIPAARSRTNCRV